MAILRVHKRQNKTVETPNTPNATTQSGTSQRLMHLLDIFRTHLTTAEEVDELVRAIISEQTTKHLAAFYLDEEHRLLAYTIQAAGPLKMPSIPQRELFQRAVETGASAIIMAQHHPEGTANSIPDDIASLRQLREAGRVLDIPVLDVVIVTEQDFVSLKDHLSRSFTEPQW
ncbi:MAG: JAB domain-containing protein [Planctomycetaceae bacterium]